MTSDGVWPLVSAAEMRALDRHTIETLGVPGDLLMESAGRAAAQTVLDVRAELPEALRGEVCVVCGAGNNGGDGLVVARHLRQAGIATRVVLLADAARLTGEAASNLSRVRAIGLSIEQADAPLPECGVVVDAIFGTGLSRDVAGLPARAISRINEARRASSALRVVSIDLPSGLDADTGQVLGVAVEADRTLAIALPKLGLALEPGRSLAGAVTVARIGIADQAPGAVPSASLWSPAAAGRILPRRPAAGHKGSFGHVLVVAGSEGKTGAAALAATAAIRSGAGLVTLACPAGLNDILEAKCTEAMTVPVADTAERSFASAAEDAILAHATERAAVALGPGVGRAPETQNLMRALAKRLELPLVIDADGLFAFASEPGMLKARQAATILTPHPGEAARLLGCSTAEINRDRVAAARQLARDTGAVVLLKGAATVAADPGGSAIVNPTGGPALATGGTGDVLTGVAVGLVAQGVPALQAAAAAAYVHGEAADRMTREIGASGLLAGDLADEVPRAAEALRRRAAERRGVAGVGFALSFPGA